MSSKIVFCGGSITKGDGWNLQNEEDRSKFYVTRLCNEIDYLNRLELVNLSSTNIPNEYVFTRAMRAIAEYGKNIEIMFCSWVPLVRYWYSPGFELYSTQDSHADCLSDIGLNTGVINKKYINNLKRRFFSLHHLHFHIVKVVEFTAIISKICKNYGIKIYFINDTCPWDKDYFVKVSGPPSNYTKFTQDVILNIHNRADDEIYKLYDKLHAEYDEVGGINEAEWVNLYRSFDRLKVDFNRDDQHPGKKSNQIFFELIKKKLIETGAC